MTGAFVDWLPPSLPDLRTPDGPLRGLRLAVKDIVDVAGLPTGAGHPDWLATQANGQPYTGNGLFLTCLNSPYYDQFLPDVMREIIDRYHPEGFADNSWASTDRSQICYCQNCSLHSCVELLVVALAELFEVQTR